MEYIRSTLSLSNIDNSIIELDRIDDDICYFSNNNKHPDKTNPILLKLGYFHEQLYDILENSKTIHQSKIDPRTKLRFNRTIADWNRHVNILRKNKTIDLTDTIMINTNQIPCFNTKIRHIKSNVQIELEKKVDTFDLDKIESDEKLISVCRHGSNPCCMLSKSNLSNWLNMLIDNLDNPDIIFDTNGPQKQVSFIEYNHFMKIKRLYCCKTHGDLIVNNNKINSINNFLCGRHFLKVKCPILKTPHCNKVDKIDKSDKCDKLLKFSTLAQQASLRLNKNKLNKIIFSLIAKRYPKAVKYCSNSSCKSSNIGFIPIATEDDLLAIVFHHGIKNKNKNNLDTMYNCKYCKVYHKMNFHQIVCPSCNVTQCAICGQIPYHDKSLCQGPIPLDIDKDLYEILIKTTKECPHCNTRTEKSAMCDHIRCTVCTTDWCYRCQQKLNKNDPYLHQCLSSKVLEGEPDPHYRQFDLTDSESESDFSENETSDDSDSEDDSEDTDTDSINRPGGSRGADGPNGTDTDDTEDNIYDDFPDDFTNGPIYVVSSDFRPNVFGISI